MKSKNVHYLFFKLLFFKNNFFFDFFLLHNFIKNIVSYSSALYSKPVNNFEYKGFYANSRARKHFF